MPLKFITGNKNKLKEVQEMLAPIEVEQLEVELAEIQSLDSHEIIQHKLQEAVKRESGELIVEDTSLFLEALNDRLPGPFKRWFLEVLEPKGIYELCRTMGKTRMHGVTIFGYADSRGKMYYFEGQNDGEVVSPRGDKDFGWGGIFQPDGHGKTYGEMEREEKYAISMRGIATRKLKEFLLKNN